MVFIDVTLCCKSAFIIFHLGLFILGQFGSSWDDSGALRNSDACTPETKVKRGILFDVTKHPIIHFPVEFGFASALANELNFKSLCRHMIVIIQKSPNLHVSKPYFVLLVLLGRGFLATSRVFLMS